MWERIKRRLEELCGWLKAEALSTKSGFATKAAKGGGGRRKGRWGMDGGDGMTGREINKL